MQYRHEIDGLRAVAVLPVILFHAGFGVFSGGYVGVDVFFVISGYLITSILIGELELGNFSIARFYERRARRILPALFFVMFACLPFAYVWMLPSQLEDFAQSLVAVVFFASNVLFWREDGYFAAAAELKPLLHTWSLAVEEQYYLLFPIFLLVLWRFGRRRVFWSVLAVAVSSLLLAEWGWRNKPSANFYLAPTRAWELLVGSICAFMTVGQAQRSNNLLSTLGLALIVFAIFVYDENTPFPSVYALVPVIGSMLVIVFAASGTWVGRFLSLRGFVGIGMISYSAYLWHQPMFAFARIRSLTEPSHALMAALAGASLLLAWATWYFIEQPFRNRSNPLHGSRRSVFALSCTVGAIFVIMGLIGHFDHGISSRFSADATIVDNAIGDRQPYDSCHVMRVEQPAVFPDDRCATASTSNFDVILFGDSHANAIAGVLPGYLHELGISSYQTSYTTCLPLPEFNFLGSFVARNCSDFAERVFNFGENAGAKVLVLTARWPLYVRGVGYDNSEGGVELKSTNYCYSRNVVWRSCDDRASIIRGMEQQILHLSKRFSVVLVYPIPEAGWHVGEQALRRLYFDEADATISTSYQVYLERSSEVLALFDRLAFENPNIYAARVYEAVCDDETDRCVNADQKGIYYYDEDHLNNLGARRVAPVIVDAIRNALGNEG